MKAVLLLPLVILLVLAVVLMPQGFNSSYSVLLGTLVLMLVVFWCILPRRYVVMDDRLRVDLGWPFGINIYYRNLAEIRSDSCGWRATVNWMTTMDPSRALRLVPKSGLNIVITPDRRGPFAEKLEKALNAWRQRSVPH